MKSLFPKQTFKNQIKLKNSLEYIQKQVSRSMYLVTFDNQTRNMFNCNSYSHKTFAEIYK